MKMKEQKDAIRLTDARVVAGRLIPVYNKKQQKQGQAAVMYLAVWVEDADGSNERSLLITREELSLMELRAKRNPEDVPKKGIITDILD